jgi:hypothetical protein
MRNWGFPGYNAGILKVSKQISDRYPFTINADQTELHFTLNQNNTASELLNGLQSHEYTFSNNWR